MKLRITVEGKSYDVDVEVMEEGEARAEESEMRIPEGVLQVPPPSDELPGDRTCRSPIAGVITAVTAVVGATVQKGEMLCAIEAMKMETKIGAPMGGTVKSVHVSAGTSVRAEQVLVELD